MGKSNDILTKAQINLAVLMLDGQSVTAAARRLGVSKSAAYRWTKLSAFKERLEEGQRAMFSEAIGQLKAASGKAVEKLVKVMGSVDEGEARRAATTILELGFRAKELDEFEARMSTHEARILVLETQGPGGEMVYELSERFLPVVMERQSIKDIRAAADRVKKPDARASK